MADVKKINKIMQGYKVVCPVILKPERGMCLGHVEYKIY